MPSLYDASAWTRKILRYPKSRKVLSDCGFDVAEIDAKTPKEMQEKLDLRTFDKNTVTLIEAHGHVLTVDRKESVLSQGGFFGMPSDELWLGTQDSPYLSMSQLSKALADKISTPQLWIDACHAGQCRYNLPTGCGVGMTCTERQTAPTTSLHRAEIVAIMCSSLGPDCTLWNKVDTNGDGKASPDEITAYLDRKFDIKRATDETVREFEVSYEDSKTEAIKLFEKRCADSKGELEKTPYAYQEVRVSCTRTDDQFPGKTFIKQSRCGELDSFLSSAKIKEAKSAETYLADKKIEEKLKAYFNAESWALIKQHWEWPNKCGRREETYGDKKHIESFSDCKLYDHIYEKGFKLTCKVNFRLIHDSRKKPHLYAVGRPDSQPNIPVVPTFQLFSTACKEKPKEAPVQKPSELKSHGEK